MNAAHLHLLLNHVPVIGTLFALAALVWGMGMKNKEILKLALWAFVVTALVAIAAFITGSHAEEVVEHLQGITKATIEEHEEAAEAAFWFMECLGALSLATIYFIQKGHKMQRAFLFLVLVMGMITFALMGWAASKGGQIRHTEITQAP